jgi:hypothetical protein
VVGGAAGSGTGTGRVGGGAGFGGTGNGSGGVGGGLKDKGPEHIDFVVVRENTGGIYTGIGGVTQKGTPLEVATQVMQYSRPVVGSRGEPLSSARRAPSREGMETLPGFPS